LKILQKVAAVRNLPPHHPEATTLLEAYRLDELIPAGALHYLDEEMLVKASTSVETCNRLRSDSTVCAGNHSFINYSQI
jgi:hypothetical protein